MTNLRQIRTVSEVGDMRAGPTPRAELLPPPAHADPFYGVKCEATGKRWGKKCGRQAQGHLIAGTLRDNTDAPKGSISEREAAVKAGLAAAAYGTPNSREIIELANLGLSPERAAGAYVSPRPDGLVEQIDSARAAFLASLPQAGQVPQAPTTPVCLFHLSAHSLDAVHPDDGPAPKAPEPQPEPVWTLDDLEPWHAHVTGYDRNFVHVSDGTRSVRCTPDEYKSKFNRHPGMGAGVAALWT
jgi:hypothetical protein